MTTTTHAASPPPRRSESKNEIRTLAIVVRDDAFDRLLTPLTFAWEMGRKGVEVDLLFTLWSARVLSTDGVDEVRIDLQHADREEWLRERLARDGEPVSILELLRLVKSTGHVRLYACKLAAQTFDVSTENLLPEADGIMDPGAFLNTVAFRADHCQYF